MNDETQIVDEAPLERKRFPVMQALKRYASLSSLLRVLGAGVLITSVSMFLFKGWSSSDDIERYLMLLAHTVVLAVTGVIIGHWVRESKGARLFLSLALVSTVVNFAVLAGLVYSQVQWDAGFTHYPRFATWDAGSPAAALVAAGAGLALLAPVSWFSFMALARRSAGQLTGIFMLSGLVLLLPVRETGYVAVAAVLLTLLLMSCTIRARRLDNTLSTAEGRFARLIPYLVPLLMVGRGMFLYGAGFMMFTTISALVFLVLRQLSLDPGCPRGARILLNRLSLLPAASTACGVTGVLLENQWLHETMWIPTIVIAAASLLMEISLRAPAGGAGYRRLAALVVTAGLLGNLWEHPEIHTALMCSVAGLVTTILGFTDKQRLVLVSGLAAFLAGTAYQCVVAFSIFDLGSWSALAIVGIIAIVAGSLLERHGVVIRARLSNWRQSFQHWEN